MNTKIVSDCDLVLPGNSVSGFKLNSLISESDEMKCLQDLSVPAGLFLINRPRIISNYVEFTYNDHAIDDNVYNKLVSSAEYTTPSIVSKKKKTKRNRKSMSKSTRKKL